MERITKQLSVLWGGRPKRLQPIAMAQLYTPTMAIDNSANGSIGQRFIPNKPNINGMDPAS